PLPCNSEGGPEGCIPPAVPYCTYNPFPSNVFNYVSSKIEVTINAPAGGTIPTAVTHFDVIPSAAYWESGKDGLISNMNSIPVVSETSNMSSVNMTITGTPKSGNGAQIAVQTGSNWSYNYAGENGSARVLATGSRRFALVNTRSGTYTFTIKD